MKGGLVERMIAGCYIKADEPGNPLVVALRMLSIPVVLFCIRLKIHPNIVTSISLALGCLGSLFYVIDEKLAYIAAWTGVHRPRLYRWYRRQKIWKRKPLRLFIRHVG